MSVHRCQRNSAATRLRGRLRVTGSTDRIWLGAAEQALQEIEFANGEIWTKADIDAAWQTYVPPAGGEIEVSVDPYGGTVVSTEANESFVIDEFVDGEAMVTYHYAAGGGHDRIGMSGHSQLVLGGIDSTDLTVRQLPFGSDGSPFARDLLLTFGTEGDSIRLSEGWFSPEPPSAELEFADSVVC